MSETKMLAELTSPRSRRQRYFYRAAALAVVFTGFTPHSI